MTQEVTYEEAVKRLSEANQVYKTRLETLENKLTEMSQGIEKNKESENQSTKQMDHLQDLVINQMQTMEKQSQQWKNTTLSKLEDKQQQWDLLTDHVRDLREEIRKVCDMLTKKQPLENENNQRVSDGTSTPQTERDGSTMNELFNNTERNQHDLNQRIRHTTTDVHHSSADSTQTPITQTIIVPSTGSIPSFSGNINESPRQFLIRVKEYAETMNRWNEHSLLSGISQFLRDIALEWYCQIRTSHRRPRTWLEFVELFLNQFNSPIRRAKQEQLWKACQQEENETINQFVVRLRALWIEQKPNETEEDLVRHLMCKMRNNLLTMIGASRCSSLDEIMIEAQKIEEILYQRNKRNNNALKHTTYANDSIAMIDYRQDDQHELQTMSTYHSDRKNKPSIYRNQMETNRHNNYRSQQEQKFSTVTTSNNRQWDRNNGMRCYICGQIGHMKTYCPNQYNNYQYRNSYSKNDVGAQDRRDRAAPMQ